MPRPALIPDEELIRKVAGFVAAGHYLETAAAFAGVAKHTYLMWLREGRRYLKAQADLPEGEQITDPTRAAYAAFLEKIDQAQATAEVRDLTVIDKVAQGGLPMGTTTRTTRRVPMMNPVTGEVMRDPNNPDEILYREETTEVVSAAVTLPQWTAAAWRLERRNPSRWSRVSKHQVSDKAKDVLPLDSIRAVLDGDDVDDDLPDLSDL